MGPLSLLQYVPIMHSTFFNPIFTFSYMKDNLGRFLYEPFWKVYAGLTTILRLCSFTLLLQSPNRGCHQTDSLFWVLSNKTAVILGWRTRFTHREHKHIQWLQCVLETQTGTVQTLWGAWTYSTVPCESNYSFLVMCVFQTVRLCYSQTHIPTVCSP